jgi:hypothetical protein
MFELFTPGEYFCVFGSQSQKILGSGRGEGYDSFPVTLLDPAKTVGGTLVTLGCQQASQDLWTAYGQDDLSSSRSH